jgi:hypothetical protein
MLKFENDIFRNINRAIKLLEKFLIGDRNENLFIIYLLIRHRKLSFVIQEERRGHLAAT